MSCTQLQTTSHVNYLVLRMYYVRPCHRCILTTCSIQHAAASHVARTGRTSGLGTLATSAFRQVHSDLWQRILEKAVSEWRTCTSCLCYRCDSTYQDICKASFDISFWLLYKTNKTMTMQGRAVRRSAWQCAWASFSVLSIWVTWLSSLSFNLILQIL